jgi:hypothetical protein
MGKTLAPKQSHWPSRFRKSRPKSPVVFPDSLANVVGDSNVERIVAASNQVTKPTFPF